MKYLILILFFSLNSVVFADSQFNPNRDFPNAKVFCEAQLNSGIVQQRLNAELDGLKGLLVNLFRSYNTVLNSTLNGEEIAIFQELPYNFSRNQNLVAVVMKDFEQLLKVKIDTNKAASLTATFRRHMKLIKRRYKTDLFRLKFYTNKNGGRTMMPVFYNANGSMSSVMKYVVSQNETNIQLASRVIAELKKANNPYFPKKTIPLGGVGASKSSMENAYRALQKPVRDRAQFESLCRKLTR